jgi:outer membrane protein assembly factor BamB
MGGSTYFGSWDLRFYCLDATTGIKVWEYKTVGGIQNSPTISIGKVYFGTGDGKLYCLDATTGAKVWEYETGKSQSSPAISNGKVYFGSNDGKFYCLDATTGIKMWEYEIGDWTYSSPVISNEKVYFGSNDGKLYCLDAANGTKVWEYQAEFIWIMSSPAISIGKVYFGTGDGKLYCLDAATGAKVWEYETGGRIQSSPAISNGKVYFGSDDYKLYCLEAATGAKVWEYETGGRIQSSPAISNGKVYFGSDDYKLYCLEAATGAKVWEYYAGIEIMSSPSSFNDKIFFGSIDGRFHCLDAKTGAKMWEFTTDGSIESFPAISKEKVFLSVNYTTTSIICLDAITGKKLWEFESDYTTTTSPAVSNDIVYYGTADKKLFCIDSQTGKKLQEFESGDYVTFSPVVLNGKVYFGSGYKKIYCVDAISGAKVWEYETNTSISSSPAISNDKVYFGSIDFKLYCLDAITGTKAWEHETGDRIHSSPAISNGKVYFGSDDGCLYCLEGTDSDTTSPAITLLKPKSANSSLAVAGDYKIEFTAKDETGIEEATVNGIRAEFLKDDLHPDGFYACTVQLKEGQNTFLIKAVDKSANRNTSKLSITIFVPVSNTSKVEIKEPTLAENNEYSKWFEDTQKVNIDFKDIEFELPKTYSNLTITKIEKMEKCTNPRYPNIPTFAVTYQIPKNLSYVKYDLKYEETQIPLNGSLITPALWQFPLPAGGKPYVLPDKEEYGLKSPPVKPDSRIIKPMSRRKVAINPAIGGNPYRWPPELNFRDTNEVIIYIKPAKYSKEDNSVFYMSSIELDIKTDIKQKDISTNLIKPAFLNIAEPYDMCIISNAGFIGSQDGNMDDFADYASWKTANGVKTKCVDVSDILSSQGDSQDSFMQIQSFIQKERELSGIRYVLLGGEDDVVPAAKVYAQAESAKVDYKAMVASDAYYCQPTKDWGSVEVENLSMIGDLRKTIDIKPNVYIGRVPVETFEELKSFIGKMTGYSSFPYSDEYNKKVLLWGRHLYESSFGGDCLDLSARDLPSLGQNYIRLYDNAPESGEAFTKYESDDFAAGFIGRENPHVVAIDSHGSTSGIDSFTDSHVDKIKNTVPGYIMASTSCNVAQFSQSKAFTPSLADRFKDPCIAEKLLFKPDGGALAYIGNTSNGWFCPGYPEYSISSLYQQHFMKNLFKVDQMGQVMTIGEAFWKAKIYCYSSLEEGVFDEYSWWVYNSLNLLGDPSFTPQMLAKVDSLRTEHIESKIKDYVSFKLKAYSKECVDMEIPDTQNIHWELFPKDYGNISVNGAICSVVANRSDSKGLLIAFYRGLKAIIPLPYKESLKMIITPASVKLKLSGAPLKIEVKIADENGKEVERKCDIEWRVDKPEIGIIGKDGILKPLKIGKCIVTAFCKELGLSGYLEIEVVN